MAKGKPAHSAAVRSAATKAPASGGLAPAGAPRRAEPTAAHTLWRHWALGSGPGAEPQDAAVAVAEQGVAHASRPLPGLARIQASFGHHDLSGVRAQVGGAAQQAATQLGARAFALGQTVAFRAAPDLRLAAHEAAHVVQQRRGVGPAPDSGRHDYRSEALAEAVADRVVARRSAESLLDQGGTGSGSRDALQLAPDGPTGEYSDIAAADKVMPAAPRPPSDVDIGFNALDISHRLTEALDQTQVKVEDDPSDDSRFFKRKRVVRHVEFDAVLAALDNLTAEQVKQVEAEYRAYNDQGSLQQDLFGRGTSGVGTDLTVHQNNRLKALLLGTRASSPQDAEAAARHRLEGDVAELRALLYGKPGAAEIERVMTLLRRPTAEAAVLVHEYDLNYALHSDLFRLGQEHAVRGMMLLTGSSLAADAYAIGVARWRIIAIDQQLAAMQPGELSFTSVAIGLSAVATPSLGMMRRSSLAALRAERKRLAQTIEERVGLVVGEAQAEAEGERLDVLQSDSHVRSRIAQVLGAPGVTEAAVGGSSARLIKAITSNHAADIVAARLRLLEEAGRLSAEALADTMRGLRSQATLMVQRLYPDASDEDLAEYERRLADEWFIRVRSQWDAAVVGDGPTFSQVLDRGKQTEVDLKRGLYMASGRLGDADELVLALAGERKDMESVKRVLRHKNAVQINALRLQYQAKTRQLPYWPLGRSLDFDLFGAAPTRAGQENPRGRRGRLTLAQGKAEGTDRLLLEDYTQRPSQEGGIEEVEYIAGRAEREFEFTIANRGATGWWRDKWGNEARSLLNASIAEVRVLRWRYRAATGNGTNPAAVRSAAARAIIQRMHLARATIRGDRAAYEKATAALRATFQAIASFVLQAVLTAVLMPFATLVFAARVAQAGAAVRFAGWTRSVVVNLASTISANKAVYGNEYNTDMLLHDLKGGIGGAIGASSVGRLAGPVAQRLNKRLGATMGNELVAGARTVGAMQATAIIEGEDAKLFENFLQQHFLGRVGDTITHGTRIALEGRTGGGSRDPQARRRQGALPDGPAPDAAHDTAPARPARDVDADIADAPRRVSMALPEPGNGPSRPTDPRSPRQTRRGMAVVAQPPPATPPRPLPTPVGTVIQARDPHDLVAAYKTYKAQIAADPQREVALLYNHALDQWAVVQGGPDSVPLASLAARGWVARDSTLARHSHPVGPGGQTEAANRLPSGRGADLEIVRGDASKGQAPQSNLHVIDIATARGPDRTFVVFDPATGIWTVDYPHEPSRGGRNRVSFATYAQYHEWFRRQYGFDPGGRVQGVPRPRPDAPDPQAPARAGSLPPHGYPEVAMTYEALPRDSMGNIEPLRAGVVYRFPGGHRVWRVGDVLRHDTVLGPGQGRRDAELELPSAGQSGRPELQGMQRSHTLGQGTGFESPFGIYYAPERVNQILQNNGLEELFRGFVNAALPGEQFVLSTQSSAHPRSLRLREVRYRLQVSRDGGPPELMFEYVIQVGNNPPNATVSHGVADTTTQRDVAAYFDLVDVPQRLRDRFARRAARGSGPVGQSSNWTAVQPLIGEPVATARLPPGYSKLQGADGRWMIRRAVANDAALQRLTVLTRADGVQVIAVWRP